MTKQQEFFSKSSKNLLTSNEVFNRIAEELDRKHGLNVQIEHDPITVRVRNYDREFELITYEKLTVVRAGHRFWLTSVGRKSEESDGKTVANLVAIPIHSVGGSEVIAAIRRFENAIDISDKVVLSLIKPDAIDINTDGDYGKDEDIDAFTNSEYPFICYDTNFEDIDENSQPSMRRYLPKSIDFYVKFCIKILKRSHRRH